MRELPSGHRVAKDHPKPTILRWAKIKTYVLAAGLGLVALALPFMKQAFPGYALFQDFEFKNAITATSILISAVVAILGWDHAQQERVQKDLFARIAALRNAWSELEKKSGICHYASMLFSAVLESDKISARLRREILAIEGRMSTVSPMSTLGSASAVATWNDKQHGNVVTALTELRLLLNARGHKELVVELEADIRRSQYGGLVDTYGGWQKESRILISTARKDRAISALVRNAEVHVEHWWLLALSSHEYNAVRTSAFKAANSAMDDIEYCLRGTVGTSWLVRLARRSGV